MREHTSVVLQLFVARSGSIAAYQLAVFGQTKPRTRDIKTCGEKK